MRLHLPHHPIVILLFFFCDHLIVILATCSHYTIRPGTRAGIYYNRSLTARRLHPWIFVPSAVGLLNKAMLLLFSRLGAHTSARWGRRDGGNPFQHGDEQLQLPHESTRATFPEARTEERSRCVQDKKTARPRFLPPRLQTFSPNQCSSAAPEQRTE